MHKKQSQFSNIKKNLTRKDYRQVLEIIGLTENPLSRTQIVDRWSQKYERQLKKANENNNQNKYIYEVINNLFKLGNLTHNERYLGITLREEADKQISDLNQKYGNTTYSNHDTGMSESKIVYLDNRQIFEDNFEVDVVDFGNQNELEKTNKKSKSERMIELIENNPRNWKFTLNLKGLLLYLINTDTHNKRIIIDNQSDFNNKKFHSNRDNKIIHEGIIGYKTIYKIITNLAKKEYCINSAYKVLQHVMIISRIDGKKAFVKFLTDISLELQNQLKLNASYLEYYIFRRCYEWIKFWYEIESFETFI